MTAQQLYLSSGLYLIVLLVIAFFTRATLRRIAGAVAGAAVVSVIALAADALGEKVGLWRMAIWAPATLPLVYVDLVISMTPLYLVTWRVDRKFGWRGLAVVASVLTVIGPPRDYAYMAKYPEWGSYAPGFAPVLAIAAIYASFLPLGHWVMSWVAGSPKSDQLARRSRESI